MLNLLLQSHENKKPWLQIFPNFAVPQKDSQKM